MLPGAGQLRGGARGAGRAWISARRSATCSPSPKAQNNIAVVYEAQGNYAQAVAYLRKSLALNAAKVHSESLAAEIHTHLGEIFARQGLNARAMQSLKRSLAVSTEARLTLQAADARLALARAYIGLGRVEPGGDRSFRSVLDIRTRPATAAAAPKH